MMDQSAYILCGVVYGAGRVSALESVVRLRKTTTSTHIVRQCTYSSHSCPLLLRPYDAFNYKQYK